MRQILIILFLGMTVLCCHAQEQSFSDDSFLRDLITDIYDDGLASDDGDASEISEDNLQQLVDDVFEQLQDMASQHLNLNALGLEELSAVPLLTEQQVMAILRYRALYGDLRSSAELALIPSLDESRRHILSHLFVFKPIPRKPVAAQINDNDSVSRQYGQGYHSIPSSLPHNVNFTIGIPTYTRKGYETPVDKGGYHGYNLMHTLRYRYRNRNIQGALTAAQNYGEPFFSGTNAKGYDFYTGYVRLRNTGILEDLVLGHYQLSVGMGLIMNKRMQTTRTMLLTAATDVRMMLSGHSSKSPSNYLQGAAATLRLPYHLHATLFASYDARDASVAKSEDGKPLTVTSLLTTGYHRTDTEIERRNTVKETVLGAALAWRRAPYYLALTLLGTHYDLPLRPTKTQFYRYFYPEGNDFLNASLSYNYLSPRLHFSGETALSYDSSSSKNTETTVVSNTDGKQFSMAISNSLRWRLTESFSLFALHRFFSYRYHSLHGRTIANSSRVTNENGIYLGSTLSPLPYLTLSAYVDYAYHPWAVYGISYPYASGSNGISTTVGKKDLTAVPPVTSRAWEHQLQAEYSRPLHFADLNIQLRYRYRDNALTDNPYLGTSMIVMPMSESVLSHHHLLRMKARLKASQWWAMAQMHYSNAKSGIDGHPSNGLLTALSGGVGRIYSVAVSLAYFNTDDYASRLYVQEPSLSYGTGTAMLYGHGLRSLLMAKYSPLSKRLSLSALLSLDHYFDRSVIGSAMQAIDGSNKCDLLLQASFSF